MALRALAFLRAFQELSIVNVFVAARAVPKRQRLLEIPARVASNAGNFGVTAKQRKFCLGMIEFKLSRNLPPSCRRMAVFTLLLE